MRAGLSYLFLLFLLLVGGPGFAFAEEEPQDAVDDIEEDEDTLEPEEFDEEDDEFDIPIPEYDEEDDMGGYAPSDIRTTVIFPDHSNGEVFIAGEPVTALVGFWNAGEETYNLSYTGASFHSPADFSYHIQNFTTLVSSIEVAPNTQHTVQYEFTPDASLEAIDFWMSGWVIYNDTDGQLFRAYWTNGTVTLGERQADVTARLIFVYVVLAAGAVGIGYAIYNALFNTKKQQRLRAAKAKDERIERGTTQKTTSDADWGTIYSPRETSKKAKRSKSRKQA